jgi:hypothetical protein
MPKYLTLGNQLVNIKLASCIQKYYNSHYILGSVLY